MKLIIKPPIKPPIKPLVNSPTEHTMKQLTEGMKSKSIKKTIKSVKFSIPLYDGGKTYIHSIIVTVEDNDNIIELIKNYQSSLKMARRAFYFRISRRYITEIEKNGLCPTCFSSIDSNAVKRIKENL